VFELKCLLIVYSYRYNNTQKIAKSSLKNWKTNQNKKLINLPNFLWVKMGYR